MTSLTLHHSSRVAQMVSIAYAMASGQSVRLPSPDLTTDHLARTVPLPPTIVLSSCLLQDSTYYSLLWYTVSRRHKRLVVHCQLHVRPIPRSAVPPVCTLGTRLQQTGTQRPSLSPVSHLRKWVSFQGPTRTNPIALFPPETNQLPHSGLAKRYTNDNAPSNPQIGRAHV